MSQRQDYHKTAPAALQAMLGLENYVRASGLEHSLLELIKCRVSQLNSCAYCLDMHSKDARFAGESEQRLYLLPVWRESLCYSLRERAALALAEAVTKLGEGGVSDAVYQQACSQFSEEEIVKLVMAIVTINSWNRLGVTFRLPAGSYQPGDHS